MAKLNVGAMRSILQIVLEVILPVSDVKFSSRTEDGEFEFTMTPTIAAKTPRAYAAGLKAHLKSVDEKETVKRIVGMKTLKFDGSESSYYSVKMRILTKDLRILKALRMTHEQLVEAVGENPALIIDIDPVENLVWVTLPTTERTAEVPSGILK